MQQLEFSFIPSRCPVLSPEQALRLWELVEALAAAIWDHYENQIVEHILARQNADDPPPYIGSADTDIPF